MKLIRTIGGITDYTYHGSPCEYSFVELRCDTDLMTPEQIEIAKEMQQRKLESMRKSVLWSDQAPNTQLYCGVAMGKVDGDTMQDLINWLYSHEDDIKHRINDFGELHNLFVQLFDREPGAALPPEEPW